MLSDEESDAPLLSVDNSLTCIPDGSDTERLPWDFSDEDSAGSQTTAARPVAEKDLLAQGRVLTAGRMTRGATPTSKTRVSAFRRGNSVLAAAAASAAPPADVPFAAVLARGNDPPEHRDSFCRRAPAFTVELRNSMQREARGAETPLNQRNTFGRDSFLRDAASSRETTPFGRVVPPAGPSDLSGEFPEANRWAAASHRRKPSMSTLSSINTPQEFSQPPTWAELEPLASEHELHSLPSRLAPEAEWHCQCGALLDVRRLVLHSSTDLDHCIRKEAPLGSIIAARVIELSDSPRSLVAKNALLTLHDLFLFAPEKIGPGSTVHDALFCTMRKATCSSFIAEEAMRALKQIVIGADTARVLHTLMLILTKQARSNCSLRSVCAMACGLYLLRLKANALNAVVQNKDFVPSFLTPILKAANDANAECRFAAAHCTYVLFNLVPDLFYKFKSAVSGELDMTATMNRVKRALRPLAEVYGLAGIREIYSACPDHAPIDVSFERLQTMLANIKEISTVTQQAPLESSSNSSTASPSSIPFTYGARSVTPGGPSSRYCPSAPTWAQRHDTEWDSRDWRSPSTRDCTPDTKPPSDRYSDQARRRQKAELLIDESKLPAYATRGYHTRPSVGTVASIPLNRHEGRRI